MKKITLMLTLLAVSFGYSQTLPFDFSDPSHLMAGQEGTVATIVDDGGDDVMQMVGGTSDWDHAQIDFSTPLDLSDDGNNTITFDFKTVSTNGAGPNQHLLKFEGGTGGPATAELFFDSTAAVGSWETITLDFGAGLGTYTKMVLFTDAGGGANTGTYLVDDIAGGTHATATCDDGIQNGDEEGVDCGGSCPNACPSGPNVINVDPSAAWSGFANVFELPANGGGYAFGQAWGVADLKTVVDAGAGNITLKPNFNTWEENPADDFWTTGGVGTSVANKVFEANTFIEDNMLADEDLTFYGNVASVDIPSGYTVTAFIKGLDPNNGFTDVVGVSADLLGGGEFSIMATAAQLSTTTTPGIIIQYGFQVVGPIADPVSETARAINGVQIIPSALGVDDLSATDFAVYPNPTQNEWNIKTNGQNITSVQVFDMLGKNVITITPNNTSAKIDASALPAGLYFARMTSEAGIKSVKLVKQ